MASAFFEEGYFGDLYKKYETELSSDLMMKVKRGGDGSHDGGISRVDGEIVYMLMRELNVVNAIEFSPNQGYSTAFLYQALRTNTDAFTFATFDILVFKAMLERMQSLDMNPTFCEGDALENIPQYIETHSLRGKIDFCFIDSDHSYDFAKRYCTELFPLLGNQCVFFIHDMCYRPMDIASFSHYGGINPLEFTGTVNAIGEGAYLNEFFLQRQEEYLLFSTHKHFGDQHEYSTKLPRNEALIDELTRTVKNFSLPASAGPTGGMPRPPMGLIVIPRTRLAAPQG